MEETTISIDSIADKSAVANTDIIVKLVISTVYCSTSFSTVVGKSAINDMTLLLSTKITPPAQMDTLCGMVLKTKMFQQRPTVPYTF